MPPRDNSQSNIFWPKQIFWPRHATVRYSYTVACVARMTCFGSNTARSRSFPHERTSEIPPFFGALSERSPCLPSQRLAVGLLSTVYCLLSTVEYWYITTWYRTDARRSCHEGRHDNKGTTTRSSGFSLPTARCGGIRMITCSVHRVTSREHGSATYSHVIPWYPSPNPISHTCYATDQCQPSSIYSATRVGASNKKREEPPTPRYLSSTYFFPSSVSSWVHIPLNKVWVLSHWIRHPVARQHKHIANWIYSWWDQDIFNIRRTFCALQSKGSGHAFLQLLLYLAKMTDFASYQVWGPAAVMMKFCRRVPSVKWLLKRAVSSELPYTSS